ncbi:hypothetical protein LOD99_4291 [Oopsacas minuta]|uniref:NLE domain-containing protein n=1 Tax=Oopsacas minuta TaxID=111878 RepID=A0AAV7JVZ4_9METZ|nr:hypothetical protein LOD99_4291 [Oopsacas minuta]
MSKQIHILLKSKDSKYPITPTNLSLSLSTSWTELNQTLLALLNELGAEIPSLTPEFDFLINEQLLTSSLQDFIATNTISTEQLIVIEYVDRRPPPSQPHILPHPDWVSSLTLVGNQVLTGSYDGSVRRWNMYSYSLVSEYKCHDEPITSVVTINDNLVVTGSSDESVCVWQGLLSDEPERCLFKGFHSQPITCLASNATQLCSGSWDRTVKVWSLTTLFDNSNLDTLQSQTLSPISTLEGHTDVVSDCICSRDTNKLISCSWDQNVLFWDITTKQNVRAMYSSKSLLSISENVHTGLIATGGSDNAIRIWNTDTDEATVIKMILKGHTGWVSSISWSHKSEHHLISGSYDGSTKHWDIRNNKSPLYTVGAHKKKLLCMDWRDGEVVISGGEDCQLIVSHF